MEKTYIIKEGIKIFYICLMSYCTFIRISNSKNNNKDIVIILLESILISCLHMTLINFIGLSYSNIISFLVYGVILKVVLKKKIDSFAATYIIALIITYMIYLVGMVLAGILIKLTIPTISYNNIASFVFILIISLCIFELVFRVKRIKNGFNFLNNKNINKTITIIAMLFTGVILLFFSILQKTDEINKITWLFFGDVLILVSIVIWTKSEITKQYKRNMKDRTIEIQKKEIDEQAKIIEDIKKENLRLAKAIHKYNNRLCALELGAKNLIEKSDKTEFADELCCILKETKEISKCFSEETTIIKTKLPVTSITGIDNMFKYMQKEAIKNNINFDLHINEKINSLIEETINKDRLETMIGDHLRNAIIAVNASNNSYKSILTTLGLVDGCYELSIYDTGIEFRIDTLLKLGKEQVTTHKDNGGSGIGFMTTFETLKESKASLIIEEYDPKTTNYTKSVTIRFDDKNEYKIRSYRSEEIKDKDKRKRMLIESI